MTPPATDDRKAFLRLLRARHPGLREALIADAVVTLAFRGEAALPSGRIGRVRELARLSWVSDAFLAQSLYRVKASAQARGIPIIDRVAHRLAIMMGQVSIGDPVIVHPGVYIVHGQVVADGLVEIHPGVSIAPFVTLGLRAGDVRGPTIGPGVSIGTGAKVIGNVTVGAGATIGANAVVVRDVAPGTTVTGAPARARDTGSA
jgi:serine O-acetyltransferase